MSVVELAERHADAAVALWDAAGLTRPWNPAHEDFSRAVAQQDAAVLGIIEGQSLLATAMVGVDGHRGWMYYVAVERARQRSGLGTAIVTAAEQWLEAHGAPKSQLMVRGTNHDARGFYERLGYEQQDVVVLGRRLGADADPDADCDTDPDA